MVTYKNVFQLARDKGYQPYDQYLPKCDGDFWESIERTNSLSKRDDLYIELTLIHKWLRDEYKIDVCVIQSNENVWYYQPLINRSPISKTIYSSYEEALLQGINEALKLI